MRVNVKFQYFELIFILYNFESVKFQTNPKHQKLKPDLMEI